MKKKQRKQTAVMCATCGQNMTEEPRDSRHGDCRQCGQGLPQAKVERNPVTLIARAFRKKAA
jgi:hypothetical protein